jgi:hypothetical protein
MIRGGALAQADGAHRQASRPGGRACSALGIPCHNGGVNLLPRNFGARDSTLSGWAGPKPTSLSAVTVDLQTGRTMTIVDEVTSPASAPPIPSALPDRYGVPLGEMPAEAVRGTLQRFLSSPEASQVPVAAFNSSI